MAAARRTAVKKILIVSAAAAMIATGGLARAETFRLVGATTFTSELMVPYQQEIEAATGHSLILLPNRSNLGVLGLFEGHHIAMISASLDSLLPELKRTHPDLAYDRLRVFNIARTRVAFSVHPGNPLRFATLKTVQRILSGEIDNWKALGGEDLPIRVVMVREGGGVQAAIESKLGFAFSPRDPIRVQISYQVNKVVEQERAALGVAQIENLRQRNVAELVTEATIEQELDMVTLGEPSNGAMSIIDAVRKIAATKPLHAGASSNAHGE